MEKFGKFIQNDRDCCTREAVCGGVEKPDIPNYRISHYESGRREEGARGRRKLRRKVRVGSPVHTHRMDSCGQMGSQCPRRSLRGIGSV